MPNTDSKTCPQCGAPLDANTTVCKYCGAEVVVQPQATVPQQQAPQYIPPQVPPNGVPQGAQFYQQTTTQYVSPQPQMYGQSQMAPGYNPYANRKSKTVAGLLAIFLGGLGVHKFYTGHIGLGILYLLFCWTYIPEIVGFIEGIMYLVATDEKFNMKYVKQK